ncbi:GntR family transcriptional regulator [Rhodovibrionaceae bacterium A322]
MAPRRLARKTTAMLVADELRERIVSGQLADGEQIRQDAVASDLGVSRIPVREALKQLEAEGLVNLVSHKGAVVAELSTSEIAELFELRLLLESWLLGLAIPRMTKRDLDKAEELVERMVAYDQISEWGVLNRQFHQTLLRPSGRSKTLEMLERVHANTDRYVRMQISMTSGQKRAHEEHQQLIALCREKDTARAIRCLEQHIDVVKNQLLEKFAQLDAQADT